MYLYRYAYHIPLMTLMGPTPCYSKSQVVCACQNFSPSIFLEKVPFLAYLIQKGVWPYSYARDIPLVTLILNIC